jgi:flagellar L-ring protein FlgH
MKRLFCLGFVLNCFLCIDNDVQADSIWDRRDQRSANLFQDNRARNVGDILTIAISENTAANEREQRALNKTTDDSVNPSFQGNSASGTGTRTGTFGATIQNQSNRTFSGSAQLTSTRTFTDRLATTVVDILPNGNLVIEGYRSRVVAGEQRVLRVTGVVRPADIGQNNTVQSQFIANFKITYLGKGPESKAVNQGIFSRFLNMIWPF